MDKSNILFPALRILLLAGFLMPALKLAHLINWSWWVVLSPVWVPWALLVAVPMGVYAFGVLLEYSEQ